MTRHSAITQQHAHTRHHLVGDDWSWQHYIDHVDGSSWGHTHDPDELDTARVEFLKEDQPGNELTYCTECDGPVFQFRRADGKLVGPYLHLRQEDWAHRPHQVTPATRLPWLQDYRNSPRPYQDLA